VHGFLGPNGAGKTTTMRLLMDYLRPDHGTMEVLGHSPRDIRQLRPQIGYVPGDLALPGNLTGRQYLQESARAHGTNHDTMNHLAKVLDAQLDLKIRELSKGNRQKIALIDGMQHRPRLLILDEPTDGLDPILRDRVRGLLRKHAKNGGTVFLSSHVVHEIQSICDSVSILVEGRLRMQAKIGELLAQEPTIISARLNDPRSVTRDLHDAGAKSIMHRTGEIRCEVRGEMVAPLQALLAHGATHLRIHEPDLEELFLRLYAGESK